VLRLRPVRIERRRGLLCSDRELARDASTCVTTAICSSDPRPSVGQLENDDSSREAQNVWTMGAIWSTTPTALSVHGTAARLEGIFQQTPLLSPSI